MVVGAWNEAAHAHARVAGRFGGLGLRDVGSREYADAAFWSAWCIRAPAARTFAAAAGRPLANVAGAPFAVAAKRRLVEAGINVTLHGLAAYTPAARAEWDASPWAQESACADFGSRHDGPSPAAVGYGAPPVSPATVKVTSRIWNLLDGIAAVKILRVE